MSVLSPFVYWAQNADRIYLKVDLQDVKDPNIVLQEKSINFDGTGIGAQGCQQYSFTLNFFENINASQENIKINDNSISITLTKAQSSWWPRLISTPQKPSWLKIDFDKWQSEDDMLDEKVTDVRDDYPDVYKNLLKNELGYNTEDFRRVYLILYNFAMLIAFVYILFVMSVTMTKLRGKEAQYLTVYVNVGHILCVVQLFQVLEILHTIFGYVRGSPIMPFMQICGRLFILFGHLEMEPRLQTMPVTTWLFFAWISSDLIRYLYYLFHMTDPSNVIRKYLLPFLKWLRYSAWLILYPVGFLCESVIIFRNMIYLNDDRRWSITLPNPYNFTFGYLTFLRIYMLFIMFPGMYTLLKHMYRARVKQLGGYEPFDKVSLFKQKVK